MERDRQEYLSAEELRNRLYHNLRDRGLFDSIKSQLRNKLVTELRQTTKGHLTERETEDVGEGSLLHRASNSLVADHLRHCKYDYSLSIFLPESSTGRDKIFTTHDMLQLLGVSSQSRLYRKMAKGQSDSNKKGFLWQLLCEISALHSNAMQESGTQTDLIKIGVVSELDEKLGEMEDFYSSKRDANFRIGATAMEERLMSFQRQLEERYRTDLKLEVARIKDSEAARIRLEEKEQCRREFDQQRRELERTYQQKSDSLLQKERNSIERMQREQEIHEKEIYAQRQSILEEIEILRKREAEVKRASEGNERERKLNEQRIKDREADIRRREQEARRMEGEYEQKLKNEMTKFKVEQQAKYMERSQNLEIREAKTRDEERRIRDEQERIQSIRDELKDKTMRINELETRVQEEKHGEVSAMRQNELLNAKLRDMADYKVTKEQNAVMKNELETLRTRLSEVMQMNERERGRQEEMMKELRRPTPETLMLQRELEKSKESLRQEQTLANAVKQQLEKRLQEEMDRNRELLRRFEDQTLQMKEMNQELVDLRAQLSITHRALTNEVYRKPHEEGNQMNRSVSFRIPNQPRQEEEEGKEEDEYLSLPGSHSKQSSPRRPVRQEYDEHDVYNDIEAEFGLPSTGKRRLYPAFSEDDVSSTNSADVVAEAKYRLKSLEREAQNLESAYRDFHYKLSNPSSGPMERQKSDRVTLDTQPKEREQESRSQRRGASPVASPIQRPLSSTPYQGRQSSSGGNLNDSLHELTGSGAERKAPPRFDLSTMSDDGNNKEPRVEERPRPITVSDLEARPGSPSIVIVPGSRSSEDEISPKLKTAAIVTATTTPLRPPMGGRLQPISLDSAWKTPNEDDGSKEEERKEEERKRKEEEEEEIKRWEEERRRKEEERQQREKELREKEERDLKKLEEGIESEKSEASKKEPEIDPVMKQYMEMVQQQKKQDDEEIAKKPMDVWSKGTNSQADTQSEFSVAEDIQSNNGSDDDFGW
ncbi:centriole and centriolar satellite protein OFD1-like isoform X3 [Ostrea edulis]|uniref:centriole and centriolar satellite protein OFD1-like isoform X3 n=1 Tax=Ostrea edulis TaxID=37623 RepID=UPI0024AFED7E|nr:centriole and centriolar satellite protein OFD1-like isoform X3 [Ostrea edulis]